MGRRCDEMLSLNHTVPFCINRFLRWLFHIDEVVLARKPRLFQFFLPLSFVCLRHQGEWSGSISAHVVNRPLAYTPYTPGFLVGFLSNTNALTITLCSPRFRGRSAGICSEWRGGEYEIRTCKTYFFLWKRNLFCFFWGHYRLWPTEAWLTMAVKGRRHLQTVW